MKIRLQLALLVGLAMPTLFLSASAEAAPHGASISATVTLLEPLVNKVVTLPALQPLENVSLSTVLPGLAKINSPVLSAVAKTPLLGTPLRLIPATVIPTFQALGGVVQQPLPGLGLLDATLKPVVNGLAASLP